MDNLRGLWRGKRVDNKVWVEGYYIYLSESDLHIIVRLDGQYNRIDPETRGECTGLTDKNGVKIFEGDIVNYNNGLVSEIYKVVYNEKYARFTFTKTNTVFAVFNVKKCEVIGNVFDTLN